MKPYYSQCEELRLNHVHVGWRVKHFRLRRNGEYCHGTVIGWDESLPEWCLVKWDKPRGLSPVMLRCLLASEKPSRT
jgi:hypothetical protein